MEALTRPRFTLPSIADAAGVEVATLRNWIRSGKILLCDHDVNIGRQGAAALVGADTALRLVLVCTLAKFGLNLEWANSIAFRFCLASAGNNIDQATGITLRPLGMLYPEGKTIITVYSDSEEPEVWNWRNKSDTSMYAASDVLTLHVDMNSLTERVEKALGLPDGSYRYRPNPSLEGGRRGEA